MVPDQIPADAPAKGPKIGLPDKYDGTRGAKAEVYVTQIGLYVLSNPRMFPDDRSKVIFSISYLTGQASEWAQPYTAKLFAGQPVTYLEFSTAFQMMYYDTECKSRAEKAIRQLKQTKSVAHYTFQFNQHAANTGWEVSTLMSQYHQGLKKDIRLALVLARVHFTALTDLCNLALKIDNEINGANPCAPDATSTGDPNTMDLSAMRGTLSNTEKADMMKAGLCFYCGEKGHIARGCPKKGKGKGKSAARIAELEEEVRRLNTSIGTSGGAGRAEESKNDAARE
ncbi:hypothetical protein PtA15_5A349 [Puccinia triticina]|uniref:CCHC-type domain-containing protein n=1 Tax=Puccinia triticina TaxID=208348 RepID=A0ABY7CKW5_9BASI|nr:uncharacterized protein PtA15_5A349 [Puccinia triticina]WAQ84776.1 hypothetical protein PtA15_5A349 [Puccinia triticina]